MDVQQLGDSADPYSFDAPSHVMLDFSPDTEDDADQWFGELNLYTFKQFYVGHDHIRFAFGALDAPKPLHARAGVPTCCNHRSVFFFLPS